MAICIGIYSCFTLGASMSADNGIYIGRFYSFGLKSKKNRFEYRVIHTQAIENCDYAIQYPKKLIDASRVEYYGDADVCYTEQEAWEQAKAFYDEVMEDDGILEYGMSRINYDVPFPKMTKREAHKYSESYWKRMAKKRYGK